jgi:hypothetical protein
MQYDNDIFVSYAHVDNEPFDNPQGWIDRFDQKLRLRVAQLLGSPPSVWRDTRLQGNEYFAGSIGDGISSTRLMLSVVSPRYVNSAWCRGEVREFSRRAAQTGDAAAGNLTRVFKIVKTHVPEEEMPEELRGLLGYHFYEFDERGRAREFRQDDPPNKDQRYWDRLEDIALDIVNAIKSLREKTDEARREASDYEDDALPLEKKVYLAETTSDVTAERDRIRRELQQRGYYVLPDRELPRRASEFEEAVREALARCVLSVHVVGSTYGLVPEGEEERSVVRWQEELAAERAASDKDFARIIWMPPGLEPQGKRHSAFVEELQTKLGAGAELLQTSVEDLKLRVLEKLKPKPAPVSTQSEETNGVKQVYLICDNRDVDDVKPVEDFLFQEGFDTKNSVLDTEGTDVAQAHREYMVKCDAALIYYGNANPMWLSTKIDDLKKARDWGRAAPFDARAVYVSSPQTPQKQRFRTHEVPVLQNFESFRPEALAPFVNALRTGNGGRA